MPNPIVTAYGPGAAAADWIPGDFLLCRNLSPWHSKAGFVSGAIRNVQRRDLWLHQRQTLTKQRRLELASRNHAVGVGGGHLVEALGHGVQRSPLDTYTPVEYLYVHTDLTGPQRDDCVDYWESEVGAAYGFATVASILLAVELDLNIGTTVHGQVICSGLIAAGLGIRRWRSNPALVKPSDLAQYHNILD